MAIRCREVQVVQVLLNLLQNAFDAVSPMDGDKWIAIEVDVREQTLVLSVIDSGRGIAPRLTEVNSIRGNCSRR